MTRSDEQRGLSCVQSLGLLVIVALGLCFSFPDAAKAQINTAAVSGTVTDATGAVIPGASLVLHNVLTNVDRPSASDGLGHYAFVEVLPGRYTLTVSKAGFQTKSMAEFALDVNQTPTYDFALSVGQTTQAVKVVAAAAAVQTASAELGTVVDRREVDDLPLNGRNFTQLLTLTAGTSPVNVSQSSTGFYSNPVGSYDYPAVGGQTNRSSMYLLDGLNDVEEWDSIYSVSPILDDIQEFKIDSHNDQAMFGGVTGGIVNVITKSGTNALHGTAWEFLRNNALDARNTFLATVTPYKLNQFGGNIGGPVVIPHLYNGRNKTFFFGSYEGIRWHQNTNSLYLVPTAAQLEGDFSALLPTTQLWNPFTTVPDPANPGKYLRTAFPNNQIQSVMDPNAVALAKLMYKSPINTGVSGTNQIDTAPKIETVDEYNLRIDEQVGTNNSFWWRDTHINSPATTTLEYAIGNQTDLAAYHAYVTAAGWTHVFSPSAVLTVGFDRNYGIELMEDFFPQADSTQILAAGNIQNTFDCAFLGGPRPCVIAGPSISGYQGWGESYSNTVVAAIFEWRADQTIIHNKHSFSFGIDVNRDATSVPSNSASETYTSTATSNLETSKGGNTLASYLLGVPEATSTRNVDHVMQSLMYGWYFQDQWRPSKRLTINIGGRYELTISPVCCGRYFNGGQNISGDLDLHNGTYILTQNAPSCAISQAPCIPGGTLPANVVITPFKNGDIIRNTHDNIEPRFGFAYRLGDKNVIRGSYGRFFDEWAAAIQLYGNYNSTWPNVGAFASSNINATVPTITSEQPLGPSPTIVPGPSPFTQTSNFVDPLWQNPYAWEWNFGIQRALSQNTILTVNYAGATDKRLDVGGYHNTAYTPGPGAISTRNPYSYITPTEYDTSDGASWYDALDVTLDRKTGKGLSFLMTYTYSKIEDLGSDGWFAAEGFSVQNIYNLRADKSVAGFDLTHMFNFSEAYQLPFGKGERFQTGNRVLNAIIGPWQANGILTLSSGIPYSITAPSTTANTGTTFLRANFTGQPVNPAVRTWSEWISQAAFTAPPAYTFGNTGRNVLRSDWPRNLDLSLFREFPITESKRLELRTEWFNSTNSVVYGTPDVGVTDANFGKVTSTHNTARIIQFALKFHF